MSKIGIVIDPHITDRHRCRQDDFLHAVLKKLHYVASHNDFVIVCGDLFHTNTNSHLVFNKVYKLLMKHRGKFFAIPGNHDLLHNNLGTLEKTTIGSLALTGALNLKLKSFEIDGVTFDVSLVMKDLEKVKRDETNSKVLIGHNYVDLPGAPKETFSREELAELNYRLVFLGHDHKPYEEEYIGNSTLIRMGSLTRIDTQEYNKNRKIYYYQLNSETLEYSKQEVPSVPTSKIYTPEAFQRVGSIKKDIDFIEIGRVLSKFKKVESQATSLHSRLVKIANEREIEYIKSLHELNGVRYY